MTHQISVSAQHTGLGPEDFGKMRAARYDRYGPPDVLHEAIVGKPVAGPGDVLVRVHGASLGGAGEAMIRAGKIAFATGHKFPMSLGVDFAGEVVGAGSNVVGLVPGDRVWGVLPHRAFGAIAEFVAVPAARVARAPRGLDLVNAAALPAVGTTAIRALKTVAVLRPGERLLIRGASGGVGSVAVQLGKAMGAHVTGLTGARSLDWVRELGADEALDYAQTAPSDLGCFDVVLDLAGTEIESYRALLARGGRMVGLAFDPDHFLKSMFFILGTAVYGARRVRTFSNNPSQSVVAELTEYVENGTVRPVVDKVWSLSEIAEAQRALEAGGVRGKYVIRLI